MIKRRNDKKTNIPTPLLLAVVLFEIAILFIVAMS
jgi:hypothetical protein